MKERQHIIEKYRNTRRHFEVLCKPLEVEDYSVQPADFVSPPKWHLAHTTWFYEQFVLIPFYPDYKIFNDHFAYLFNSYYNNAGQRVHRPNRGLMTRPSVKSVYDYRAYVDRELTSYMESEAREEVWERIDLGINHEEQHQELFLYDIKYILGHQPDFPIYNTQFDGIQQIQNETPLSIEGGLYEVGYNGKNFCYDNEQSRHKVYLNDYRIHGNLVTNGDFLDFINDSGYTNFNLWHAEGWDFIKQNQINAPMYWHLIEGQWHNYELTGLETIDLSKPVSHLSYFEAFAFAEWAGKRLPTEFEWEVAADQLNWGALWEWTESSYLPYPKFQKADGALGEYNGKFMVNQKVLRGASYGTALGHSRKTYRNFFHPHMRWHFGGLRLAEKI